jgi:GR25 family glycosyltransferase involved in LPS biosynthesis
VHLNEYFDGIYWINLHRSERRRRCTAAWFTREGIDATRVEAVDGEAIRFLLPKEEQESGARLYAGCMASHMQAMAMY